MCVEDSVSLKESVRDRDRHREREREKECFGKEMKRECVCAREKGTEREGVRV